MPFDATEYQVETKPPITRLIEALRGPEPKWWDFGMCSTCALHTAVECGLIADEDFMFVARALQMHHMKAGVIFGAHVSGTDQRARHVRPRHVAAALEHYRDTGEALSPFVFVQKGRG